MMISNLIDFNVREVLNWPFAFALGQRAAVGHADRLFRPRRAGREAACRARCSHERRPRRIAAGAVAAVPGLLRAAVSRRAGAGRRSRCRSARRPVLDCFPRSRAGASTAASSTAPTGCTRWRSRSQVALGTMVLATVVGVLAALGLARLRRARARCARRGAADPAAHRADHRLRRRRLQPLSEARSGRQRRRLGAARTACSPRRSSSSSSAAPCAAWIPRWPRPRAAWAPDRVTTFFRVVFPQIRLAVAGSALFALQRVVRRGRRDAVHQRHANQDAAGEGVGCDPVRDLADPARHLHPRRRRDAAAARADARRDEPAREIPHCIGIDPWPTSPASPASAAARLTARARTSCSAPSATTCWRRTTTWPGCAPAWIATRSPLARPGYGAGANCCRSSTTRRSSRSARATRRCCAATGSRAPSAFASSG